MRKRSLDHISETFSISGSDKNGLKFKHKNKICWVRRDV